MKDGNEYHGPNCVPSTETLLSAIAGMTLVMICLVTPAPAASFEGRLQEFLQGPPFEFTVEFQGLKPAIDVAKVEDPQPTLSLPPLTPKTGEPTLNQIREFAEAVLVDNL